MSKICHDFDAYFDAWNAQIGALCFLLVPRRRAAQDIAFQSFLRLGAAKDPQVPERDAKNLLFCSAVRLCDDYYLKNMRRRPSKKALEAAALPFPVTDGVLALIRLPFARRAALALSLFGFDAQEIAQILHKSIHAIQKLLQDPAISGWQDAVLSMSATEEESLALNDRIYDRFAERTIPVENAIHDARNLFDRVAPLLAAAVLALFALSVWYVARL